MSSARTLLLALVLGMLALAGCGKASTNAISNTPSSIAGIGVAAPGSVGSAAAPTTGAPTCPESSTTHFAKSKFALHVGLAAGTFHRYLYKPLKAGAFRKGAPGRVSALITAGSTALFDEHELRLAVADVHASPALCKVLIAPLSALTASFDAVKTKLTAGDTTGLDKVNSSLAAISSSSAKGGVPIAESTNENAG